jgi:hypothetical protein
MKENNYKESQLNGKKDEPIFKMRGPNEPMRPFSEISKFAQDMVMRTLLDDWKVMPKEFKIRYLKLGGLERLHLVGVKVPEELLRKAGLLGGDDA